MDEVASDAYKIKTTGFEGPLELLLSLIEQRKFFVNEVSLAEVTNDYITYIKTLTEKPKDKHIADVSYFILIASTLILIKSKSLLPNLSLTEDEKEKIDDLESRLKLYQIIKNASIEVKNNFGAKIIFMPNERVWSMPIFSPDKSITIQSLSQLVGEVIANVPKKVEKLPEIEVKKMINIDQVINSLTNRIENSLKLSFKDFVKSHNAKDEKEAKVHVIVSFLAMLELVREGIINVMQDISFGDIEINKQVAEETATEI